MKKSVLMLAICLMMILAMGVASFAYPSTGADWGVQAVVNKEDGSVTISFDADKVEASADGAAVDYAVIAIAEEDKGLTADSGMASFENIAGQTWYPHTEAVVSNAAGMIDAVTYKVLKGEKSADTGSYPFEEGKTYYVYICAHNANATPGQNDWCWNYAPFSFKYTTQETGGNGNTGDTDDSGSTGDLSVLAYAAAAAAGCGALVIRKKR